MSEEERRPMGLPPFYWAKAPARAQTPSTAIVNRQQRKFQTVVTAFKLAKVVAAAMLALLIIGRI
jgi:hypothetical protein